MGKQSTARKKAHQGEAKDEDTANGDSSSVQEAVHHQEDEGNNSDFDVMVDVFKNRKDDSENQSAKDKVALVRFFGIPGFLFHIHTSVPYESQVHSLLQQIAIFLIEFREITGGSGHLQFD